MTSFKVVVNLAAIRDFTYSFKTHYPQILQNDFNTFP